MKKVLPILILLALPAISLAQKEGDVKPPSAPVNFSYQMVGDLGISFTWDPPLDSGGSEIDGYNFTSVGGSQNHSVSGLIDTSYSVDKLERGVFYEFSVTAYNYLYESASSDVLTVSIPPIGDPGDETPPVITNGPNVTEITDTSVNISWNTDEQAYASLIFDVHKTEPHNIIEYQKLSDSHQFSITGLIPCSTNYYFIKNVDPFENILYSDVLSFTTSGCLGGCFKK
ncbi:MAG: large repetitive protein [Patescibacteria group bacterium]|jgi:hypothetical protein|nr:large repetitive protein [Patescibacteria group bacterium]